MHRLANIRSGKPDFYPDQSIYAEYACAEFGLTFEDISAGAGVVFSVASNGNRLHFGAGRCSWYPQNNATASTLASDKYLTNAILERAGIATLGGAYFFAHVLREKRWNVVKTGFASVGFAPIIITTSVSSTESKSWVPADVPNVVESP